MNWTRRESGLIVPNRHFEKPVLVRYHDRDRDRDRDGQVRIVVAPAGLSLRWSDDFNRADSNDIGGDWLDLQSAPPGLSISGGAMIHSGSLNNGAASAAGDAIGAGVDTFKTEWTLNPVSWAADNFNIGHLDDVVDGAFNMEFQSADGIYLEPTGASSLRAMRLVSGATTQLAVFSTGDLSGASHKYTLETAFDGGGNCVLTVLIDDVAPTLSSGSLTDASPPTGLQTSARPACTSRATSLTTFTLVSVYY